MDCSRKRRNLYLKSEKFSPRVLRLRYHRLIAPHITVPRFALYTSQREPSHVTQRPKVGPIAKEERRTRAMANKHKLPY